ncbi:hypothetical protein HYALB_00008233 [Hymenoscyphus albidus]|uniref:Uncharacterized protein n=1 Tax=Hymenoscyphus albidus TaxID=595503 RepID=A0A9N9LMI7_9HELO|nr:hypothetical protein HYALB_00008233 [Hymenoscyphus albidus]
MGLVVKKALDRVVGRATQGRDARLTLEDLSVASYKKNLVLCNRPPELTHRTNEDSSETCKLPKSYTHERTERAEAASDPGGAGDGVNTSKFRHKTRQIDRSSGHFSTYGIVRPVWGGRGRGRFAPVMKETWESGTRGDVMAMGSSREIRGNGFACIWKRRINQFRGRGTDLKWIERIMAHTSGKFLMTLGFEVEVVERVEEGATE